MLGGVLVLSTNAVWATLAVELDSNINKYFKTFLSIPIILYGLYAE